MSSQSRDDPVLARDDPIFGGMADTEKQPVAEKTEPGTEQVAQKHPRDGMDVAANTAVIFHNTVYVRLVE